MLALTHHMNYLLPVSRAVLRYELTWCVTLACSPVIIITIIPVVTGSICYVMGRSQIGILQHARMESMLTTSVPVRVLLIGGRRGPV